MAYNTIAEIGEFTLGSQNFSFEKGNPCNILTEDNILMFCDNVIVDSTVSGTIVGYVSNTQTMAPKYILRIPVVIMSSTNSASISLIRIHPDGSLRVASSMTNSKICLDGLCIHINNNYYTPQIGNIYNNGTSPLDAR